MSRSGDPAPASRKARLWAVVAVVAFVLALNWMIEWRGRPPEPSRDPPLPYPSDATASDRTHR